MASFNDAAKQATQFWVSRTTRQKAFLAVGAAATVLLLTIFVQLIAKPDYKPLSTGLEAADAQALSSQLDAAGISHQLSADGKTVSVPADKLDAARMQVAAQGAPHGGRTGFELFDKMSWGQTEFDEKVSYQRALEGELERTIETLSEVKSARVHLVMATDSIYEDRQRNGKASVILKLRGNGLSKSSVVAISRLVSGAVDELKPEDVSIVDADSDRSLGLGHDGAMDGDSLDNSLAQRLISTLEPVVGVDKIRASVNVEHDMGSSDENQEKYDPAGKVLLSDQTSEDQAGGGAIPSGVPGTTSNVPSLKNTKPANVSSPEATQSSKTESAQYGVNKSVVHRLVPAGRIERVTAAILVDDEVVKTVKGGKTTFTTRKRTQEELNKIQELAAAVIGFDEKRGDTLTVQNMSFASNASDAELPPPAIGERVQKVTTQYGPILRPVSLLVLFLLAYLFMVRPIQKQALSPGKASLPLEAALAAGSGQERHALNPTDVTDPNQRARRLKDETMELIAQKPANTARAVQAWLREEPS